MSASLLCCYLSLNTMFNVMRDNFDLNMHVFCMLNV